jgi:chromosome segregation ATPase
MALAQEDIQFIKDHLGEWLAERSLGKPPAVYEIELRERMVRVEEELRHQRELMREGFAQMDQRHQELRLDMAARFEQVDKRFEQVDKRFEQVDKRFEQVDKRFEQVDRRFESVQQDIRELQRRMDRFMIWSFGTTLAAAGLVVTLVKFWNP